MLEDLEILDGLGIFDSPDIFDGENVVGNTCFEVCNQLFLVGLADLLGMGLLEL